MRTEYTKNKLLGLGKLDRSQLSAVIRGTKGSITVSEAADILQITPSEKRGVYSNPP